MSETYDYAAIRKRLLSPENGRHSDETQIVPTRIWLRQQAKKLDPAPVPPARSIPPHAEAEIMQRWAEFELAMEAAKEAQRRAIQSEIDFARATAAAAVPLKAIVIAVASHYRLAISDMLSERRDNRAVTARHMAMFIARHHTPRSLPQIGNAIGRRDHTTILYGIRKMTKRLETEPALAIDLAEIRLRLGIVESPASGSTERGEQSIG